MHIAKFLNTASFIEQLGWLLLLIVNKVRDHIKRNNPELSPLISRGKRSNLGQLKKNSKLFLLSFARKNELFLQHPIRRHNVFFSIVLGLLKKTEVLLSYSAVIFYTSIIN